MKTRKTSAKKRKAPLPNPLPNRRANAPLIDSTRSRLGMDDALGKVCARRNEYRQARTVRGAVIDFQSMPAIRDVLLRDLEWVPSPIARAVGRHMDRHVPLCASPNFDRLAHQPLLKFLTHPLDGRILDGQVEAFLDAYRTYVIWAWGYAFPRLTIHGAPFDLIRRQMIELRIVLEKSCGRAPKSSACLLAAQHMVMLNVVNVAAAAAVSVELRDQVSMLAATARSVADVMAYWNPEDLSFHGKDSLQIGAAVLKRLCAFPR